MNISLLKNEGKKKISKFSQPSWHKLFSARHAPGVPCFWENPVKGENGTLKAECENRSHEV